MATLRDITTLYVLVFVTYRSVNNYAKCVTIVILHNVIIFETASLTTIIHRSTNVHTLKLTDNVFHRMVYCLSNSVFFSFLTVNISQKYGLKYNTHF